MPRSPDLVKFGVFYSEKWKNWYQTCVYLFRVNNGNPRWNLFKFKRCSGVSIVAEFEQVNTFWMVIAARLYISYNYCQFSISNNFVDIININPLQPGVVFLYPLKTSENLNVF